MAPAERPTGQALNLPSRLLARDPDAYLDLANTYGPGLRTYALRKGIPKGDAEDAALDVLLWVYSHIERFEQADGEAGFERWMFSHAKWAAVRYLKVRSLTMPLETGAADLDGNRSPSKEEIRWAEEWFAAQRDERQGDEDKGSDARAVAILVERLSPADREILHLREFGLQASYAEVAAKLGIQEGTARVRHKRAVDRLKCLVAGEPPAPDESADGRSKE